MDTIEVVFDEEGRLTGPKGVRLRLSGVEVQYPLPPPDRQERLDAIFRSIAEDADAVALKPWPENDPIVEKYRRKGLIE